MVVVDAVPDVLVLVVVVDVVSVVVVPPAVCRLSCRHVPDGRSTSRRVAHRGVCGCRIVLTFSSFLQATANSSRREARSGQSSDFFIGKTSPSGIKRSVK